ncbi:MAG: BamA/TamA family outer membrane protein [Bacteroidales bacterium]|nr:BamA/TamA family outer membrane protein [Candidatus Equibacterium intestinale]
MRRIIPVALICILACSKALAGDGDVVKTGLNFGPLPVVAYDADKGFQYGALLNIFNYGDGTNYPNYDSKWYFEASFFTKGSQLYQVMYDNKELIPGVRWSSAIAATVDKAMDFYGFNGYQSYLNADAIAAGKEGSSYLFTPFYRMSRVQILAQTDFIGKIADRFSWEAGYHASYFKIGSIDYANINKGKSDAQAYPVTEPTLYDSYCKWGIISEDEAEGGFTSSVRLGLVYDSRDKEGAPSRGIWAEAHLQAAPKWLGTTNPYTRYSFTWRNYLPIISNDVLTFAYRLNYEGTIGDNAPFYVLPYITVMGENCDKDGMGGYRTVRGILRDRVCGLDMASYNAEFRWRFTHFTLGKQNIALGLSAFSDGSVVTRDRDLTFNYSKNAADYAQQLALYNKYVDTSAADKLHITAGAGFRFIMNENFIVAVEYGKPLTNLMKNSSHYNQDGTGAFYINTGFLF